MSNWPAPHHGMVSEYQASGVPFVTSSASGEVSTTAGIGDTNVTLAAR